MTFRLAGLVRLGGDPIVSAFLIPFFRSDASNHFFAQELDDDRRIVGFRQFTPFRYDVHPAPVPALSRDEGDIGILAFTRRGGPPVVAPADEIVGRLRRAKLAHDRSPFFEIDVYRLTHQLQKMEGAIARATRALGGGPIAQAWARREMKVAGRETPHEFDFDWYKRELQHLTGDLDASDWIERWMHLWTSNFDKAPLADLGLRFVLESSRPTPDRGKILLRLAGSRRFGGLEAFGPACIAWLRDCARVMPGSPDWGRIWRAANQAGVFLPDDLTEAAITHLEHALRGARGFGHWPALWRQLYADARVDGADDKVRRLLQLAEASLVGRKAEGRFAKLVVRALLTPAADAATMQVLWDWVTGGRRHSPAWADAYLAVLQARPTDLSLIEVGRAWLEEDPGHLNRWHKVHAGVLKAAGGGVWFTDVAREWLKRANRQMNSWPAIAMFVLRADPDPETIALVRDWMTKHPIHPTAWELSLALPTDEESVLIAMSAI